MLEDELRKTFEELNTQPLPRTFGAVDIVYHGARVKRRRRGYAVAATGAGTAAMVAVVVAFALNQTPNPTRDDPAVPPATDTTTSRPQRSEPSTPATSPPAGATESPTTTDPEIGGDVPPGPTTRTTTPGVQLPPSPPYPSSGPSAMTTRPDLIPATTNGNG